MNLIIIDDNFEELKKYGFIQSKVSIYPQTLVKVVDIEKKYIVEVCNEPLRGYNVWSGEDWKDVGVLKLWECNRLDMEYKYRDGEVSPYYERNRTNNALLTEYIQDFAHLIK